MADVKDKIALIQSIFIDYKEKSLSIFNYKKLHKSLLKKKGEFISLAYEAASMGIAINNLKETSSLNDWSTFYQKFGETHPSQIHIGLGWALSELNLKTSEYIKDMEPFYKFRVIDGFGYHEGRFKRRRAVRTQQIPIELDEMCIRANIQGLGRSLCYTAQGCSEKLSKLKSLLSIERHFDMWRGAGVTLAYAGGVDSLILQYLLQHSGENQNAFKCGIALTIQNREKADTLSKEIENISKEVLNLDCSEVSKKIKELVPKADSNSDNLFFNWITKIEQNI